MARILVADDDRNARLLIRTLAEHAGHDVVEAADGERALLLARESPPDLAIVDLSMPLVSGPDFVRALRKDERTRTVRVALYTATLRTAAIDAFIDAYGICAVLPKPGEPAALLAALEAALGAALEP